MFRTNELALPLDPSTCSQKSAFFPVTLNTDDLVGYNFKSLQHISPFLEPTASGITSLWARTTALKYDCIVTAGYPEKVDVSPKWPASPEYYNSAITVNREGETIANYRKSFLYYTDETWALEGPDGFFDGRFEELGNVAMGICKSETNPFEREYIMLNTRKRLTNDF
jgi:predicted amidohydrolase